MLRRCSNLQSIGFDLYIELSRESLNNLRNYLSIARKVKQVVRRYWPGAEVYVFGSVVNGRYTAASDIDVLVVTDKEMGLEEAARVKAEIYISVNAPIQLHVVSREKLRSWYMRFADRIVRVD